MEKKFTPGPWKINKAYKDICVFDLDNKHWAMVPIAS